MTSRPETQRRVLDMADMLTLQARLTADMDGARTPALLAQRLSVLPPERTSDGAAREI